MDNSKREGKRSVLLDERTTHVLEQLRASVDMTWSDTIFRICDAWAKQNKLPITELAAVKADPLAEIRARLTATKES